MTPMLWLALGFIGLQCVTIVLLVILNRTFGVWAKAAVKEHHSNTVIYFQALKILEYANHVMQEEKEEKRA